MCQYGFEEESHAKNTKTQRKRESLVVKEKNRLPQAYCSAELRTILKAPVPKGGEEKDLKDQ